MRHPEGKVVLVGAGPGDRGLISIKALNALSTSDVILYDALVNPRLLEYCKADAQRIAVGKKSGLHPVPQDRIEALLIEHARQGKTVCRLKGGDPLLFGRGSEEMEALATAGIRYEVVPGISSALAAPAYAGIPVTQRGTSSGVAIFTGHEDPCKEESDLYWPAIAGLGTTLVFLMGMKHLSTIVENLMRHGMRTTTPVAIVHQGTTPLQQTLIGTLSDIVPIVEHAHIGAPSVIVVGDVVQLRQRLAWFEHQPLFGRKILVTRTRHQASPLTKGLEDHGALVRELPTIEIEAREDAFPILERCIDDLAQFAWIVFTSANAVEIFFTRLLQRGLDARALANTKICVIGPATGNELACYSLNPDCMPDRYIAESVAAALRSHVRGKRILLPRSDIARPELVELLTQDGAMVTEVPIYHIRRPDVSADTLEGIVSESEVVTFTSSSTVTNFVEILGDTFSRIRQTVAAASIGPVTSESLRSAGIRIACEARTHTIPGLIDAIVEHFTRDER